MFKEKAVLFPLIILFIFFISINTVYSQEEKGEIIIVSEWVGEEIDQEEKEKFKLFQEI